MFCHTIFNLKVCDKCFTIHNNIKETDSRSKIKELFNKNVIEDEIKRDFSISKIINVEMAPNTFYGFYQQLDSVDQHELIVADSGSAEILVINVDPEDENFGEHQKVIVWKGNGVYIAPRHVFGIAPTKKGFRGKLMFGAPFVVEHYYSYDAVFIQEHNEKFPEYRFTNVHFIERKNLLNEISKSEIKQLIKQQINKEIYHETCPLF